MAFRILLLGNKTNYKHCKLTYLWLCNNDEIRQKTYWQYYFIDFFCYEVNDCALEIAQILVILHRQAFDRNYKPITRTSHEFCSELYPVQLVVLKVHQTMQFFGQKFAITASNAHLVFHVKPEQINRRRTFAEHQKCCETCQSWWDTIRRLKMWCFRIGQKVARCCIPVSKHNILALWALLTHFVSNRFRGTFSAVVFRVDVL